MDKTMWDYIKYLYKKYYNIPPRIVDLMASEHILEMCTEGTSNEKIAVYHDVPVDYVIEIINQYFSFNGWDTDLDINPSQVYNTIDKNYNMYVKTVSTVTAMMDLAGVRKSFNICSKLEIIRKEIKQYVE